MKQRLFLSLVVASLVVLGGASATGHQSPSPPASPIAASGDFSGLVDIGGGRKLYLTCRGTGSPTVILEAGYPNDADIWTPLALPPGSRMTAVLPGVATFTRVCAYDRPGTVLDAAHYGRSTPVPMPRTARDIVADLHTLLHAAGVPGPYVLVAHSIGGIFVRLYAATYPAEVAGLVLVDASHEDQNARLQAVLTPAQWTEFERLQTQVPASLAGSPIERLDFDASFAELRAAERVHPLSPVPLVVLSHGVPYSEFVPADALPPGFPWGKVERVWQELQDQLAVLVPNARHVIANQSGHYIQLEQPDLVIAAVRQVVDAVRDPASWTSPAATPIASPVAASGDFSGLIDIGGGRKLYLTCHGSGGPTVVLEAGYRSPATVWTEDLTGSGQPTVFAGVSHFTRVCAYERPGTDVVLNGKVVTSRSTPVPMPRTAQSVVTDLHTLLHVAGVKGPYVLVGHSLGGLFVRLYASAYPDEVAGMVLVDAWSEELKDLLTPVEWSSYVTFNSEVPPELKDDKNYETIDFAAASATMWQAAAAHPLRSMPLVVLSHGQPIGVPAAGLGFPPEKLEQAWTQAQDGLAKLVPDARHVIANQSGHYIQLEQPDLVIAAVRQVVDAVRDPATWTSPAATPTASPVATSGAFAGSVDIGGRKLYLKCRGSGGPTVVLVGGCRNDADIWDSIALPSGSQETAVLPGVAAFTRVCAYDGPGTLLDASHLSRSDPVPMPRTARDVVTELQALLHVGGVPGPYVLVGHSFGGLFARLYASTYPDEVAGMVLDDALSERIAPLLTPAEWADYQPVNNQVPPGLEQYHALETLDFAASFARMRRAVAAHPLRPLPVVVLSYGQPFDVPESALGFPPETLERVWTQAQHEMTAEIPGARHVVATQSQQ